MGGQLSASGPALSLALRGEGVAAVEGGGVLGFYDVEGVRTSSSALPVGAQAALPFGEGWLVRIDEGTSLSPTNAKPVRGKPAVFADGSSTVNAFAVAVDGVAVARAASCELWTHAGKERWSVEGAFVAVAIVPGHVIALGHDGALGFLALRDGVLLGSVRLASTDPPSEWRLSVIDAGHVALALGDWLVWVDVATRKTIRRVRAREKITALTADAEWVVCGTENGFVQAFAAKSGETGGAFDVDQGAGAVTTLALGKKALFTGGACPSVRAFPRAKLDITKRPSSPVTALASRGDLVAVGDGAGTVRVLRGDTELVARPLGEALTAVHFARGELLVAATSRGILRVAHPWQASHPLALRSPVSAFAADEDYAFAGTELGAVDVYELATGNHVTTYALSDAEVTALARLPGRRLVIGTGALDGRVFVVDVAEAKVLHRLEPHDEAFGVTCLAYDQRGRIVASGADDGSIALLDPMRGKVLARLRVRETPTSLAFDTDGRRIACVFADGTAGLVRLERSGATMEDIALTGAARVVWARDAVFGFADGHVESLRRDPEREAHSAP